MLDKNQSLWRMLFPSKLITSRQDASHPDPVTLRTIMGHFESIGDDCELGTVQRFSDIEPLGLFRFSNTKIPQLIHALDTDLAFYGAAGDLDIIIDADSRAWCKSIRYDFTYLIGSLTQHPNIDRTLSQQYTKVNFLKRHMLEELSEGHKIFVRRDRVQDSSDDFMRLAAAIRRHGPSTVMQVVETACEAEAGQVRWHAPGIIQGKIRRGFARSSSETWRENFEAWVELCRNAYCLALGIADIPAPRYSAIRPSGKPRKHTTGRRAGGMTSYPVRVDAEPLKRGSLNAFSAWVWLPRDFRGDRVFAFARFSGSYQQFGYHDADLAVRDAWQRVWISVRLPRDLTRLELGLSTVAEAGQVFWSMDWRIGEDAIPLPAAPPPSAPVG